MDGDNNDISPEKMEKILQYQEITGIESLEIAETHLERFEWQLEVAIQDQLAVNDPVERRRNSLRRRGNYVVTDDYSHTDSDIDSDSDDDMIQPPARPVVQVGFFRFIFDSVTGTVLFPFRMAFSAMYSVIKFVQSLVYHRQPLVPPHTEVMNFIERYNQLYGPHNIPFFRGTYAEALTRAKSELKFLVVYIHSEKHQDTPQFCRTTMCDPMLTALFNEVILWGINVEARQAKKVSLAMRETTYPYFGIVALRSNHMRVVAVHEGTGSAETLCNTIRTSMSDNERYFVNARVERREREVTANLRQEQDAAYQESLRVDREKAKKRQLEQQKKEEEENKRREEEQRIKDEKLNRKQMKIEWADRILPEPDAECADVLQIMVKLPKGTRLQRRFRSTDSLSALFYFVFCHPEAPDRLQFSTTFPKKVIPCEPTEEVPNPPTFQEFGLVDRTAVFVADLEA